MELFELQKIVKKRKRVGRGEASGWGKTSGRGANGEKSRSGGAKGPYFEGGQTPFIRRTVKRGFANIFRTEYEVVNLDTLNNICKDGDVVTKEYLQDKGIVKRRDPLKILGRGNLDKKISVIADAFSNSAKEKIKQAGGSTEELR